MLRASCATCGLSFTLEEAEALPRGKARCVRCGATADLGTARAGGGGAGPLGASATHCPICAAALPSGTLWCCRCGAEPGARGEWVEGRLALPRGATLRASHCVMCTSASGIERVSKAVSYRPLWALLCLLFGVVPGLLLIAYFRQTEVIEFPLCRRCERNWRLAEAVPFVFALVLLFALPTVLMPIAGDDALTPLGLLMFGFGFVALAFHFACLPRLQATCVLIDSKRVVLRLPRTLELKSAWEAGGASDHQP